MQSVMTFNDITANGIFWPMLVMIAAINVACGGLSSADLGIVSFLKDFLSPLVEGLTPFGFFIALVIVAYVITNILDGAVVAYITIPIM
jgi:di/tricarboxylate transporter